MSSAPAFKTVIFFDQDKVLVFSQGKKGWLRSEGRYSLDSLPDKELRDVVGDSSVLAVVNDSLCGHLQIVLPNKKDQYSDENIGQVLQKEHHIDLDVYEFASQRFPLGRENVQVSISGIEKDFFHRVETWVSALGAKKFWVVPFGWFVSSLKSVEPVLMAVILDEDEVLVSHHYLGVDDARTISLQELKDYAKARREERKETHLLYVQGDPQLRRKATTSVGDEVAVHPLLPEDSADPFAAVIEAVMAKGGETLAELLHFVGEERRPSEAKPKEKKTKGKTVEEDQVVAAMSEPALAEDLPKPTLPESMPAEIEPETGLTEETMRSAARTVVEIEPEEVTASEEDKSAGAGIPEPRLTIQPTEEPPVGAALSSQLQGEGLVRDNTDRYLEMPKQSSWRGPVLVFLAVAIVTGVVGGAVLWSRQVWSPGPSLLPEGELVSPTPTPTPTPSPTPEATPAGQLSAEEKQKTRVIVLNATGIAGLAGKAKTKLSEAGWKTVQTGNAEGTYDGATFVFTEEESLIPVLAEDLGAELKRAPQVKESQAAGYAVVIILAERISLE